MSEQSTPSAGTLRITLVRSLIGRPKDQEETVKSLRIRRLYQTVEHPDTPMVRGMIRKVRHLVEVEETSE
jgi:large subunit ribosomal protein L30